jgi:alanyl-tRNA synthetase
MKNTLYKVVEVTTVTDEELERVINEWVQKGWSLNTIQFAMRDASKRPAMAFVIFTMSEEG